MLSILESWLVPEAEKPVGTEASEKCVWVQLWLQPAVHLEKEFVRAN